MKRTDLHLPAEIVGRIVATTGVGGNAKKLKSLGLGKDIEAYTRVSHTDMYKDVREAMKGVLERVKEKLAEPNQYSETDRAFPDHILAAWPLRDVKYTGYRLDEMVLTPESCEVVAGDLEHSLVEVRRGALELHVYLPTPPGLKALSLVLDEELSYHTDDYDDDDTDDHNDDVEFNYITRTVNVALVMDDGKSFNVSLYMSSRAWSHSYGIHARPVESNDAEKLNDGQRFDIISGVVQSLLSVQGRLYLKTYITRLQSQEPLNGHIQDTCRRYGVVSCERI